MSKLRVLLHFKDHPWKTSSGYAIAARNLVQGLYNDLDLAVFAPVGQKYSIDYYMPDGGVFCPEKEWEIVSNVNPKDNFFFNKFVPVYPGITEGNGEEIVEEHFQHFKAEVLWQCVDVWSLSKIPDLCANGRIRWVVQPPVDFLDPIPDSVIDKLKKASMVVPWVQSAYDQLKSAGVNNLYDPIPIGVNCDVWKPQERTDFPDHMKMFGFGYDTFNISMVNANQHGRKAWEQSLRGIKAFRERHPEVNVRLYVHTLVSGGGDGWDLHGLINMIGLGSITRIPNQYYVVTNQIGERTVMMAHALADVVLNPGLEGFGLATINAQAVGTPVIGLAAGATLDIMKKGVFVKPYYDWLAPNFLHKVDPHPLAIADALDVVMQTPRDEFEDNVGYVKENFDWPVVVGKWRKFWNEFDADLDKRCVKSGLYPPKPSEPLVELAKQEVYVNE